MNYEFMITPRQSKSHNANVVIDTDFADDIALLYNSQAQELLYRVESAACDSGGVHINSLSLLHIQLFAFNTGTAPCPNHIWSET